MNDVDYWLESRRNCRLTSRNFTLPGLKLNYLLLLKLKLLCRKLKLNPDHAQVFFPSLYPLFWEGSRCRLAKKVSSPYLFRENRKVFTLEYGSVFKRNLWTPYPGQKFPLWNLKHLPTSRFERVPLHIYKCLLCVDFQSYNNFNEYLIFSLSTCRKFIFHIIYAIILRIRS